MAQSHLKRDIRFKSVFILATYNQQNQKTDINYFKNCFEKNNNKLTSGNVWNSFIHNVREFKRQSLITELKITEL